MTTDLPTAMRAAQWTSKSSGGLAETLTFNATTPLPPDAISLPKDSTLVKVAYMSLNHIDYKLPEAPVVGSRMFTQPTIPGRDFAGTVIATTLPGLKENDRVCGKSDPPVFGTLAEYVVIQGKEGIVKVPDNVSLEQAACIGVAGVTGYQCLAPHVKAGDEVLINGGSGGTGTVQIQMAKILGCYVTATCSGANAELCKSLGADEVIDYKAGDLISELKRRGTQYDLIIDNVSPEPIYSNSGHYLKPAGLFITIAGSFTIGSALQMGRIQYLPSWLGGGTRKAKFLLEHSDAEAYRQIVDWMAEGKLNMVVEKRYELEEAREAFVELRKGRTKGKILIKVAGE